MVAALRRLFGEHAAQLDKANEEVFRRLDRGVPQLVAVRPAAEVIPALAEGRTILHPGPPIEIDRVCDPLRRSMRATIVSEGWADDAEAADALLVSGEVQLAPANLNITVVPMATTVGPSFPVWCLELEEGGVKSHAPIGQGPGDVAWYGKDSPGAIERLGFLRDVVGPILNQALEAVGPVDVMSLASQAVAMGDDCHVRVQAATNLLLRTLLPGLMTAEGERLDEAGEFLSGNYLNFLGLGMAAARALTLWAGQVPNSLVVTGLCRNGTDVACWLGDAHEATWFTTDAPMVGNALYHPGRSEDEAAPDIGDSSLLELIGLGGAAAANSPSVAQFVGGTMAHAAKVTEHLDDVCVDRSTRIKLPIWQGRGAPLAVDVRRVVELGQTPQITTGILDAHQGTGQVGAGVSVIPVEIFRDALLDLDARLSAASQS